ncbi:hypothetical protein VNI00_009928 [Paramarasmius palmivorus]|uniref:Uncharacterized protein n=1 Tax=Paramarasmius palmivorus TaxID=297713 RepID=A0AAW0CML7_9AGAR
MLIRRALFRIFKLYVYLARIWLVVGALYLALPSPLPSEDAVVSDLHYGNTIRRVFTLSSFFPTSEKLDSVWNIHFGHGSYHHFIMEFQLLRQNGTDVLAFGRTKNPMDSAGLFGGSETFMTPAYRHHLPLDQFDGDYEDISVSRPFMLPRIPLGNPGGLLAPVPWIGTADSVLLTWNHEYKDMPLRIRKVPSEELIEVWPESSFWATIGPGEVPPKLVPLLSIRVPGSASPSFTFAPYPTSSSPSLLFPVRVAMVTYVLIPIAELTIFFIPYVLLLFENMSTFAMFILNVAAIGVVGVAGYGLYWWIKNERPNMSASLNDVRTALDSTLEHARLRAESSPTQNDDASDATDLEAQVETKV